uniref:DUF8211 domain-containing protein n=3 Tax=Rhizophagus irregularis TaxID=588596 RepID=U9UFP4_RHIID
MSRASKIDSRNTTTKNFFNFSYKRYRFHFGIYIPCSHDYITPGFPGFSPPKTICKVPTPFIMSDFRRACVLHQPSFFKNDVFIHIKNVKKELNVDSTNPSLKPKIFHANLLYTHWNTHRTKRIYSRRLGISYEETIHARDRHSITHLNNKHIYRKKLCNLSIRRSHNPRVSKAQETRFDRAKRRIFNTKEHNRMDLIQHKYATAQRYRFLFSETQFVLKPIKHLLYNQGLHHGNYKFWTPFFGRPGKRFMTTTINDTPPSLPLITYTVAPYNPTPNMFIPHKYRNIIPKEPLYTEEGVYIVPGSREWFTYMYNLHNNLPPPLTKAQRRALQRENERIAHFRLNQENAIMQGTSVHRVRPRQFLKDRLSTFCERVHDKMMKLTTQYLETDNEITKSKVYKTMSNYCTNIFEDDNIRSNKHMRYGNQSHLNMFGVPVDTSDDAKELELRPKKRRFSSHTTNLYPSIDNTDRFKRRRLSPAVMDDSTGVKIH